MKHAIVFSTLLAVAAGFFTLGQVQRANYRAEMLAAGSQAVAPVPTVQWQVADADPEHDGDADDGDAARLID